MIPGVLGYGVLIRWGAGLLFLALCAGGLVKCGYDKGTAKLEAERAAHKAVLDNLAAKTARAARLAEEASKAIAVSQAETNETHEQGLTDAYQRGKAAGAAVRAGDLRLQDWWACHSSGPAEGDAAGPAAADDGAGELRAAGAGDLVQVAAEADADRTWYIRTLIDTRKACGVEP